MWARVTGMSLNRRYPFESTKITVASFPLNLTFSLREKELPGPGWPGDYVD